MTEDTQVKYRDPDYFNENDYYVIYSSGLYKITRIELWNGHWYAVHPLIVKMSTVKSVNANVMIGKTAYTEDNEFFGKIVHYKTNTIRVQWRRNQEYKSNEPIPHHWVNINDVIIKQ